MRKERDDVGNEEWREAGFDFWIDNERIKG